MRSRIRPEPPDAGGGGAPEQKAPDEGGEPQWSAGSDVAPSGPQTRPASNIARFIAFLADVFVVASATAFLGSIVSSDGGAAVIWRLLAITLIYEALFVQEGGQTFGKSLADIHVVSTDGEPPTAVHAWMRALFKTGQFACCGLTLAAALFTRDRRGLHDMIAGTCVVKKVSGDEVGP